MSSSSHSSSVPVSDSHPDGSGSSPSLSSLINEEYRVWKKNSPFLYDLVISHALEWPSLTVQWLPDKQQPPNKDYTIQRLILGTHTNSNDDEDERNGTAGDKSKSRSDDRNYLMIAEVRLPTPDAEIDAREFATTNELESKLPSASSSSSSSVASSSSSSSASNNALPPGSYGSRSGRVEIIQFIPHDTEVNRARYMPHNPNLIVTRPSAPHLYVFDRTHHPSRPSPAEAETQRCRPDLKLVGGHEAEGFGVAWNPHTSGLILSGCEAGIVCVWDINSAHKEKTTINPTHLYKGAHNDIVSEVAWHSHSPTLFASASDDQTVCVWDMKSSLTSSSGSSPRPKPVHTVRGHKDAVNSVSFHPFSEFLFASASSDSSVLVWDLRSLSHPLHTLQSHTDQVYSVQWSPFSSDILASGGADRRICVWDLSRIGAEQEEEDAADGPPELLFVHGGHTDKIADFSWNASEGEEFILSSVADDNILQIWQMAENIYDGEEGAGGEGKSIHEEKEAVIGSSTEEKKQ